MAKYVVKNERGEWLTLQVVPWSARRDDQASTDTRWLAFEWTRKFGGKVYGVRKVTARREREAIARHLRQRSLDAPLALRDILLTVALEIEDLEHRRKHA